MQPCQWRNILLSVAFIQPLVIEMPFPLIINILIFHFRMNCWLNELVSWRTIYLLQELIILSVRMSISVSITWKLKFPLVFSPFFFFKDAVVICLHDVSMQNGSLLCSSRTACHWYQLVCRHWCDRIRSITILHSVHYLLSVATLCCVWGSFYTYMHALNQPWVTPQLTSKYGPFCGF